MNKGYSNIITNYHLTDGGAEFYETTEADEIINFEDSDGVKHNVSSIRIDADGSDLNINFLRTNDSDEVSHATSVVLVGTGTFVSFDNVRFNGVRVNGASGQSIKYTALY